MFRKYFTTAPLLTLLGSALLLSGCAADRQSGFLSGFDNNIEGTADNDVNDPDLKYLSAESDAELNEELRALSATGEWSGTNTVAGQGTARLFDFPVVMNNQVEMYLNLFQNSHRRSFANWLARSGKYLPFMEHELEKAGLPKDLVYLSMIESGYSQRAYSRARAVGLWQFMQATGKQYNLKIDSYIDQRVDPEKSTKAAVTYLRELYREFGDWHLAVAAYNAGPGKIRNGLKRYKVDNFWDLAQHRYLHLETKRYVPKLIAAIMIAREPEKYGFTNIAYEAPLTYDKIQVEPGMPLEAVAVISGTNVKEIKALNQELRRGKTPPNKVGYSVKIPAGSRTLAMSNLENLHSYISTGYKTHTIKRGETIASVCSKYNLNATALLKVNNLRSSRLKPGTSLRIPYPTVKYQLLPDGDKSKLAAYNDNLILHKIKKGETISKIAKKYRVPQNMIVSWNGLKSVHSIRAGQQLALFIEDANKPSSGKKRILASTSKLIVEQPAAGRIASTGSVPTLSAQKKNLQDEVSIPSDYNWYRVKDGDSLWTISRRFNISAESIREWNNLESNLIHPGSKLIIRKG